MGSGMWKTHKEVGSDLNVGIGSGNSHSLRFPMSTQVFTHSFTSISSFLMFDVKTVFVLGYFNIKKNISNVYVKRSIVNIVNCEEKRFLD